MWLSVQPLSRRRAAANAPGPFGRGGIRTRTRVTPQGVLSPQRLPFRHSPTESWLRVCLSDPASQVLLSYRVHCPGKAQQPLTTPTGCIPNRGAVCGVAWNDPRLRGHAHRQHAHASVGMPPKMGRTHSHCRFRPRAGPECNRPLRAAPHAVDFVPWFITSFVTIRSCCIPGGEGGRPGPGGNLRHPQLKPLPIIVCV